MPGVNIRFFKITVSVKNIGNKNDLNKYSVFAIKLFKCNKHNMLNPLTSANSPS